MAERKSKPKDSLTYYTGDNGRVNKCADLMRRHMIRTGGSLLDVGGAIGDLGYAVRDLFEKRWVLDISEKNLDAAKMKGNLTINTDVDKCEIPMPDDHFDVITALDFIEHIIDPENFARECHRLLKPSGEVFINTPNIRFWRHISRLLVDGRFPHTSNDKEVYHGGHLAFYTYSDLREIFEPAGFTSFEQIKDEECYETPPQHWLFSLDLKNQKDYVSACLELGCPNLLYRAVSIK
jgi:ubiquinone/menaquinone biosynthesis C-methylase UbiE